MEAGTAAHYWARKLQDYGHEVKLIAPQFVKGFLKSNKNDANDAEAIVIASTHPSMRYVSIKAAWQVELQSLHRIRTRIVTCRVQLTNSIRGFLQEYGIILPQSAVKFRAELVRLISPDCNELRSPRFKRELSVMYEELLGYLAREKDLTQTLVKYARENTVSQRLQTIPGVGPIIATALYAGVADPNSFKNGREMAAWLGLVPRQHSTGGKERLLGISKRGDTNLRCLLVHGARGVYRRMKANPEKYALGPWVLEKAQSRGVNKAVIALANKMARIAWVVMARETEFSYGV
jgi:transposase